MPYLRIRDRDLYYREHGSGPLAVYVHAYMTDHTMWLDQMADLEASRHSVAIDLPGFGRSDPIVPGFLDARDYADDVAAVIEHFGGPADLVGFSAGAGVALQVAVRRPDLARSLVLISAGLRGLTAPRPVGDVPVSGERGADNYLQTNQERAVFEGKGALFDRFQVAGYHFGPEATDFAKARYRAMFEGTRTDMMVSTFMTLEQQPDYTPLLDEVSLPVLFVRGSDESVTARAEIEARATRMHDARLADIPQSGRFVMLENPHAFSTELVRFWS